MIAYMLENHNKGKQNTFCMENFSFDKQKQDLEKRKGFLTNNNNTAV